MFRNGEDNGVEFGSSSLPAVLFDLTLARWEEKRKEVKSDGERTALAHIKRKGKEIYIYIYIINEKNEERSWYIGNRK